MMTLLQIAGEIENLTFDERLSLITIVAHSLQKPQPTKVAVPHILKLRGFLRPTGTLPSDDELEAMRTDYLLEKYS